MPGSLENIRVIDFGHYVAGPLTAVMLADQGADVIHVDAPGSTASEHPADAFLNRNKRRITLDLKSAEGLEQAKALIASADVVIENFRPGVMDRLGLGWDDLAPTSPGLVYCSLPGFGADDPRASLPGWQGVIDAATGNCQTRLGEVPDGWDDTVPTYCALPVASNFAAFLAAFGIVTALTARLASGRGQRIEVPLYNAVFESIGDAGGFVRSRGLRPRLMLSGRGSGTFECADGRYVQFNPIGSSSRFMLWFMQAAGVSEWAAEGFTDTARVKADPSLGAELQRRVAELFLTRTAADWEDLINDAGAPGSLVRTGAEWLRTDHARIAGHVVEIDDPKLGPTWMAGLPVHTTGTPVEVTQARHLPDADHAEVLAELATLAASVPAGAPATGPVDMPYDGLRVVDLTQILAGPSSARILAEFGADVTKLNSPQRPVSAHAVVNRGKKSVLLDIESEAGKEVLWKLIEDADVFVQNFPHGTADRYGIGYDHLRARRPGIVYISVSCYGYSGPWRARRGYETQGQATTGIMTRTGGTHKPGVLGPYNVLDYGTGVMAAFASSLGIFHQRRTGEGQHVHTSLAQTGTYQQTPFLMEYEGKVWDEPAGPEAIGTGPLQRFYQSNTGWLFLGAKRAQLDVLAAIPGFGGVAGLAGDELVAELIRVFATDTTEHWLPLLQAAGLGAHQVVSLAELMDDPWARSRGLSVSEITEAHGEVIYPGNSISLSLTPARMGPAGARPGQDAAAVLERIGMGDRLEQLERVWALQVHDLPQSWDGN